jgi:hypothetical protein
MFTGQSIRYSLLPPMIDTPMGGARIQVYGAIK